VDKAANIPLTFGGRALFMTNNVLPAMLSAFLRGVSIEDLRVAMGTFIPSPAQTPGRMNLFRFRQFEIMVDYAHNTAGLEAIAKFLDRTDAPRKVGVISGVGDRRDEDIISLGSTAAGMFDEIIIRQDRNLRGRSDSEIIALMTQGIQAKRPGYSPVVIPEEHKAIEHTVRTAQKGDFIVICSDVVPDALNQIMQLKEEEEKAG
jgi:cyanophycin synthetase